MIIYVVKPGDTLSSIAKRFSTDLDSLVEINDIENPNDLVVGEALIIQQNLNSMYVVQPGDNLSSIAKKYNIPLLELLDVNPNLSPPYNLYVGQKIVIEPNEENRKNIWLNGFAYSTSSSDEVANALDDLSFLSIFAYRYDNDGKLVNINDTRLVKLSESYAADALLVITNQNEKGSFSSTYANKMLSSEELQNNLFADIINKLKQTAYSGVVVDFEYVSPNDTAIYITFLEKLRKVVKDAGNYLFLVALAPKYSSAQKGLLYEAHDYNRIGEISDYVIIMTYEWGYTYGPPMAVSPLPAVENVIKYAITVINHEKIWLGLPNYGYDFTLPYVKGKSVAKSVNNRNMPAYAKKHHAIIQFDERQQSPYIKYTEDGVNHIVYFSDARSINAMSALVAKYDLGGISIWTLNKYYAPIFEVITDRFIVKKPNSNQ